MFKAIRRNFLGLRLAFTRAISFRQYWQMNGETLEFLFDANTANQEILKLIKARNAAKNASILRVISEETIRILINNNILAIQDLESISTEHLSSLKNSRDGYSSALFHCLMDRVISIKQWLSFRIDTLYNLNNISIGGFNLSSTTPLPYAIKFVVPADLLPRLESHHFHALSNLSLYDTDQKPFINLLKQTEVNGFVAIQSKFPPHRLLKLKPWMADVVNTSDFHAYCRYYSTDFKGVNKFLAMQSLEEWQAENARTQDILRNNKNGVVVTRDFRTAANNDAAKQPSLSSLATNDNGSQSNEADKPAVDKKPAPKIKPSLEGFA